MDSSSSNTQTPAIRTFQMDGSSQGSLASSVNLFRGDVNLSQSLFSLPGRSPDGLDVAISIQYQSNVFRAASLWSKDSPTGVLGLGWELPLTWIEAYGGASPVAATRQYVFNDNGSSNQLFRQPLVPVLFTMSTPPGLTDGAPVPAQLVSQFRSQGLAISTSAVVHGSGPWSISDDALLQSFTLTKQGAAVAVCDGGELYQLQNYQFWKAIYYPTYERWLIVDEKGMRRSFGGQLAPTGNGFARSIGNSVAWSVYWSDANGRPAWTGAHGNISGQLQVARAWYLCEIRDRFGSAVTYSYNGGSRSAAGIIPLVEQQVGTGGKPYTKAVYLDTITDSFGRTVHFTYGQKLWSATSTAPREYHDPHRATPSNDPGPYQDRYETQYLASIEVRAASGSQMYSFAFDYAPRPAQSGPERAVANMTTYSDSTLGDTYKRLLTSVTQRDQDGVASPGLRFEYDLGSSTDGGQPGALLSVTKPHGGKARYKYQKHDLPICDRALIANRPGSVSSGAASRVFYGTDYAVVCFYNQAKLQLSMEVYTWTGRWLRWTPTATALLDTQGLDLSSLNVSAQADFLAVSCNRSNGDLRLYVYQRDTARPGQWRPATVNGVTTGQDVPTCTYKAQVTPVQLCGGSSFLLVLDQTNISQSPYLGSYDVLTWRWTTGSWTRTSTTLSQYSWIAAGPEWFAILGKDRSLSLAYLDGTLSWGQAAPLQLAGLAISSATSIQLAAGAGLLTIANLTTATAQQNSYSIYVAQWNADYRITLNQYGPFTDSFGLDSSGHQNPPLPWTPTVVGDSLIAINGNVLRRTGSGWLASTALNPGSNPLAGSSQRFAYGPDVALRVLVAGSSAAADVIAYDPTSGAWTPATRTSTALPAQQTANDNWPSTGDADWLFVGPYAWFRGTATDWSKVIATSPSVNLTALAGGTFNSASLVNQSPGFVAFTVTDRSANQSAHALTLRNGSADISSAFTTEKLFAGSSAGGAGTSASGPQLFASFPVGSASVDQTQSVTLRRYAGYGVDGPITHYTVTRVQMDDGFGSPIYTSYGFDITTAAADPTGNIVKFYTNTTYPGSDSNTSAPCGSVVARYLNGVTDPAGQTGDNYYDMLDGMLVSTEIRDAGGVLLESKSSTWTVLQQVASSPTDAAAPGVQLRGGWVTQTSEVAMKDGLTVTTLTGYIPPGFSLPVTGQPVTRRRDSTGGSGLAEYFTGTTHHGVHYYPSLWAIHALTDVAQADVFQGSGSVQTLMSSHVTTYTSWSSSAGEGVMTPASAASYALRGTSATSFPFSTGTVPAGWVLSSRTAGRSPWGQESVTVDAMGVATSTIFDTKGLMAVASIANAMPAECAYLGFQSYENSGGWTLTNVTYDGASAYTGSQSAILPAGSAATISVTVRPTRADTWIVGCRYSTHGLTPDGSGIEAHIDLGGGQQTVLTLPWTSTKDVWTYVTLPIPVASVAGGIGAITVVARSAAVGNVSIDSILVAPLVTAATLRTFDPDSQQILSTMDAGGRTSRTCYDRGYRPTAAVNASGLVRELSSSFLSRRGSQTDSFEPGSPNAELTLHSAAGGVIETFYDGSGWASRWQPAVAKDWSTQSGCLLHKLATASPLTWATKPGGTYAIYFEPQTSDPSATISIAAGDVQVKWSAGWSAQQGSVAWTPLAFPSTVANHWLLVVGDGVVLFFGDGQLLFSQPTRPSGKTVALTVTGTVRLRNLTAVQDVRLGLSHNDACGRQRQLHQLRGKDSQVCALIFDALDRRIATTRSAPGSFGSGAASPPLAYRPGFVDVPAFLSSTRGDWQMQGDIASYYSGQVENGIARSSDLGYPYSGVRYEASPRPVKLETSLPGKDFAINLQIAPSQRKTTQYSYGTNAGQVGALPASQYIETRVTSAAKTVASRLTDRLEQQVAMQFIDPSGALASQSTGSRTYAAPAAGPTTSLVQQTPNAQLPGPQGSPAAFVRTLLTNALSQTASLSDVDSGSTSFIYDSAGNLRFVLPAMGSGEQWYIYYKYDALGRRVEEGTVASPWSPQTLQQQADSRLLPSSGDSTVTPVVITEYDGTGGDPTAIGMKTRTTAKNPAPGSIKGAGNITVKEDFTYGPDGNITKVNQTVSGGLALSGAIGHKFNALGELVQMDLPAGCPIASIYYGYDDHGSVTTVGKTPGGAELGTFGYSADRHPESWSVPGWSRLITYTGQGWVQSSVTSATAGSQSFALSHTYQADGVMDSRRANWSFPSFSRSYSDTFTYDGHRRLAGASGDSNVQFTSYDPNGNLFTAVHAGKTTSLQHAAGKNQVSSASIEGGAQSALSWNARGQLVSGLGRSFEYLPSLGRTRAITTSTAQVALAYGGNQQRVVKQNMLPGPGRANVYFHGSGQTPVASQMNGVWGVTVWGPMGPIAWVSDRTYYLLSDTSHSVWGAVTDTGLSFATAWTPFGTVGASFGDSSVVPYGYQGHEWDSEVGLHNFKARLYDPALCRFLAPDPQSQFSSGYLFAGNNPLTWIDPTGELSLWARVGIGMGMAALAVAGTGLILATGGAAAPGLGAAEATLAAEATASGVAAGTGSAAAAAATATAATAEVTAGASVSASLSLSSFAGSLAGSTLSGLGTAGLEYDMKHGRSFTAKGFGEAVGIGAASGFASGVVGGLARPVIAMEIATTKTPMEAAIVGFGIKGAFGFYSGAAGASVSTILTNVVNHKPWYHNLARNAAIGAAEGYALGAAKGVPKGLWQQRKMVTEEMVNRGVISDATRWKIVDMPSLAKELAKDSRVQAGAAAGTYFVGMGWLLAGAITGHC